MQSIADPLGRIRQTMEAEREHVKDYEVCIGFLDVAAEQQLESPEGRVTATSLLEKIKEKCGGVPGLVSLTASTLSAVSALAWTRSDVISAAPRSARCGRAARR